MNMGFMSHITEKCPREEKGVSEVLGVILIIGMAVAVFVSFYAAWRQTAIHNLEAEHMSTIETSFLNLKSGIEGLGGGGSISTDIKLGRNTIGFGPDSQQAGALSISPANMETIRVYPIYDTYVAENSENTKFGGENSLQVASEIDNNERSFLMFSLESVPTGATIMRADLWLYCYNYGFTMMGVTDVQCCPVDNDSWSENSLTWGNPPMENALDSLYVGGSGWISLTAKDFVAQKINGNKIVSLGLMMKQGNYDSTMRYVSFSSKEGPENNMPYLEVAYVVGPGGSDWPVQSENVSREGGTTGVAGAQHNDGVYENIYENDYGG
jgi:hypothetical protein